MSNKKGSYHHGALKEAIIKEAISLIRTKGFDGFSLRDISKRIQVSHSAPYRHFKTKQELLAAIATEGFKDLAKQLDDAISSNPEDMQKLIMSSCLIYYRFAQRRPNQYQLMFGNIIYKPEDFPELIQESQKAFGVFQFLFQKFLNERKIKKNTNPTYLAFYSWSLVHGMISLMKDNKLGIAFKNKNKRFQENLVQEIFAYYLEGISDK